MDKLRLLIITDKLVGGTFMLQVNNKYFAVLVAFDVDYARNTKLWGVPLSCYKERNCDMKSG